MSEQMKHEMERQRTIREILDADRKYLSDLLENWNNRRQEDLLAKWDDEIDNNTLWEV